MNAMHEILSHEVIWKLGWALVHSLWQAAAIAVLLAVALVLMRKASANARYLTACAGLLLMAVMPIVTMCVVEAPDRPVQVLEPEVQALATMPIMDLPEPAAAPVSVPVPMDEATISAIPALTPTPPTEPWLPTALASVEHALPYLVVAWLLGVFSLSLWHLGGWAQLRRLKRRMITPVAHELKQQAERLAETFGIRRAVQVVHSALVEVPTLVGWLKPMILLPASALSGLSPDQLEAILAHELAHVRRHDYLANLLQTVIEIFGFYHPAIWWVSRRIRIERENCCDDMAAAYAGDRQLYARALATMEKLRVQNGLALAAGGGSLVDRIRRLGGTDRGPARRVVWFPAVLALLVVTAIGFSAGLIGSSVQADDAETMHPKTIVVSPRAPWFASSWSGRDNTPFASCEPIEDGICFEVYEADKRKVWVLFTKARIDWERYPMVVVRYRAGGLRNNVSGYGLWLDDTTGPNRDQIYAFRQTDWVDDGETREVRFDLRDHEPPLQGPVVGMALGIQADENGDAWLDLLDLRFESVPDAKPPQVFERDAPVSLLVVDSEFEPVPGAVIRMDPGWSALEVKARADTAGAAQLLPWRTGEPGEHALLVEAEGMLPFLHRNIRQLAGDPIKIVLGRSQTMSGRVLNENGEPVRGAVVAPRASSMRRRVRLSLPWAVPIEITDAEGRWRSMRIPADATRVDLRIVHPEYDGASVRAREQSTLTSMRDGTATSILRRGIRVQGSVIDGRTGEPITGAWVGRTCRGSPLRVTYSGDDGSFTCPASPPGPIDVTVQADGYHPEIVSTMAQAGMDSITVTLGEPATVRFRVVDPEGKPMKGFLIDVEMWRGLRTLAWAGISDEEGRVVWKSAPRDEVTYQVGREGWEFIPNYTVRANEQEHVIVVHKELQVHKPLRVTGRVVHAETKEPIDSFTFMPGILREESRSPSWQRHYAENGRNGAFDAVYGASGNKRVICVESPGFAPAVSRGIGNDEGEVELLFELEPSEGMTGKVVDAEGNAVADAVVVAATHYLFIKNGRELGGSDDHIVTQTDADGVFRLPPMVQKKWTLVVFGEPGYAEVGSDDAEALQLVRLKPWATVEGVLTIGRQPGADQRISVYMKDPFERDAVLIRHDDIATTTDAQGRFSVPRVRPGDVRVVHAIPSGQDSWCYTQSVPLYLEPGATAQVELGGKGRPVTGRLVLPPEYDGDMDWRYGVHSYLASKVNVPDMQAYLPEGWETMGDEQRKGWRTKWQKTDEGKDFEARRREARVKQRAFSFSVNRDGGFRANDVPAGEYELHMGAYGPLRERSRGYSSDLIASLSHEFEIPPMPGGRSDKAFDLGELTVVLQSNVRVGQAAPDFTAPTLDGESFSSADSRGKFVLLHFWKPSSGPDRGETPQLKEVFDQFGGREDFVMVGLSLEDPDEIRMYTPRSQMNWVQCYLDADEGQKIAAAYGVFGIPSIWLLDPEGKVRAKDLRGERILQAVEQALGVEGEPGRE